MFAIECKAQLFKFQSGVGYAIVTGNDFKKISLAKQVMIGSEFILKEFLYIDLMAGITTLQYSRDNANTENYFKKQYASLAACLKKYYPLSKKSSFFWEVGPAFNYDFKVLQEIYTNADHTNISQKNLGSTLSLNGNAGFKTQMLRNVFFDVTLYTQTDFFTFYSKTANKTKTNRQLLSFTLYFKLKK